MALNLRDAETVAEALYELVSGGEYAIDAISILHDELSSSQEVDETFRRSAINALCAVRNTYPQGAQVEQLTNLLCNVDEVKTEFVRILSDRLLGTR